MTATAQHQSAKQQKQLILISWVSVLCFSLFPNILFTEITHQTQTWILGAKLAALALLILVDFRVSVLFKLRNFYIILTGIHLFEFLAYKLPFIPR